MSLIPIDILISGRHPFQDLLKITSTIFQISTKFSSRKAVTSNNLASTRKLFLPNFGAMKLNYIGHELTYALFKFVWMFFYSFSLRRLLNFDGKIRKHFQQSFQCLCYQHTILSINGNQKIGNKCFQFLESLRNFRSSVQPQSKPVAHTTS